MKRLVGIANVTLTGFILSACSFAGAAEKDSASVVLTAHGQELQTQYESALNTLGAELQNSLPAVDPEKKAAYLKARDIEKRAKEEKDNDE